MADGSLPAAGTDWQTQPFVTISPSTTRRRPSYEDVKEAFGVPAQKKPATLGTTLAKAVLAATARLVSALSPQPVLQPIPVRVKSGRRR